MLLWSDGSDLHGSCRSGLPGTSWRDLIGAGIAPTENCPPGVRFNANLKGTGTPGRCESRPFICGQVWAPSVCRFPGVGELGGPASAPMSRALIVQRRRQRRLTARGSGADLRSPLTGAVAITQRQPLFVQPDSGGAILGVRERNEEWCRRGGKPPRFECSGERAGVVCAGGCRRAGSLGARGGADANRGRARRRRCRSAVGLCQSGGVSDIRLSDRTVARPGLSGQLPAPSAHDGAGSPSLISSATPQPRSRASPRS